MQVESCSLTVGLVGLGQMISEANCILCTHRRILQDHPDDQWRSSEERLAMTIFGYYSSLVQDFYPFDS